MSRRFPARDQVAIVGVGTTPFSRASGKSDVALAVEASKNAIRDAGLTKDDIDGISATMLPAQVVQAALGISELTYFVNSFPTFAQQIVNAMNAVFSGVCDTVLCYHNVAVSPYNSRSAAADPFRTRNVPRGGQRPPSPWPDSLAFAPSYAAWANRYFHDHDLGREYLGYIAINSRTNGLRNEHASLRTPITMEDYLAAPMVRGPLFGVLDMDYPVDGADALVVTTAERAKDLPNKPVLIHAAVLGQTNHTVEENLPDLEHSAHQVTMDALWQRSELTLPDIDLFQPYDGFSFICLKWFESVGYCGVGEAGGVHHGQLGHGREPDPDRWARPRQHARRKPLRRRHPGQRPHPRGGFAASGQGREPSAPRGQVGLARRRRLLPLHRRIDLASGLTHVPNRCTSESEVHHGRAA